MTTQPNQLGRCDLKQYEHCGPHERIPEVGQRLPPFGCKNWVPEPQPIRASSGSRESDFDRALKDVIARQPESAPAHDLAPFDDPAWDKAAEQRAQQIFGALQSETPAQLKRRCDTCHLESGAFKSTPTGFQWLPIGSRCAWASCEGHVEETPPDRSVSITSDELASPDGKPSPLAFKVAEFLLKHDGGLRNSTFIPAAANIIQGGLEEAARITIDSYAPAITSDRAKRIARVVFGSANTLELSRVPNPIGGANTVQVVRFLDEDELADIITAELGAPDGVEAALAELREMFPNESFLYARNEVRHSRSAGRDAITGEPAPYVETIYDAKIQIGGTSFPGTTLTECLQAVREWRDAKEGVDD